MNDYYNWNPFAAECSALKRDANFIGIVWLTLTVLLTFIFKLILLALNFLGFADFRIGSTGFLIAYAAAYCIGMGLPAPVTAAIARRHLRPFSRYEGEGEEERELRPYTIVLALMAGLAICIFANFATSYILQIFSLFGIESPQMPSYLEKTGISLFLNILIVSIFPAILEEMVFRGYFLRTLLPYGEGFAILVSSVLFAMMHGNILQIPFAFIVGLTCGYLVIHTGRIWPAMLLHFLNNFMSILMEYVQLDGTDAQNQMMTIMVFAMIGLIGLLSLLILFALNDPIVQRIKPRMQGGLTGSQKAGAILTAPAFLISLLLSVGMTIYSTIKGVV